MTAKTTRRKSPRRKSVATKGKRAAKKRASKPKSDASGRAFNVQGPAGHCKIARSDAHDQEERRFAKALVQRLEKAAGVDAFDRLVITADPRTLGLLRKYMSGALSRRVSMELNLDLTGLPARDLDQKIRLKLRKPVT